MNRVAALPATIAFVLLAAAPAAHAQTLRGSTVAMSRQHSVAQQHDFSFLKTSRDVRRFIDLGLLVPVRGNASYELAGVSHPYARPAVRTFIERLSSQYRSACGEQLVVTSLTRPVREQPYNASDLSVHPAGMAIDLRVSRKTSCRQWIERVLMSLEKQGVLDATRERTPPHYHVALFPDPYLRYVDRLAGSAAPRVASAEADAAAPSSDASESEIRNYLVNRGDSLWSIARRHGTSVAELKALNNLSSSRIAAGQVISVPASSR